MNVARDTTQVATLKEALSKVEDNAAMERTEREKQDARVGEVQQELQEFGKKFESLEHDFKSKHSSLPNHSRARKMPRPKPKRPSRKSRRPRR